MKKCLPMRLLRPEFFHFLHVREDQQMRSHKSSQKTSATTTPKRQTTYINQTTPKTVYPKRNDNDCRPCLRFKQLPNGYESLEAFRSIFRSFGGETCSQAERRARSFVKYSRHDGMLGIQLDGRLVSQPIDESFFFEGSLVQKAGHENSLGGPQS